MTYVRSLFLNFLIVFFIDRVMPGIEILNFEQVPNVGADLLFSLIVGFLNASVFPFLAILEIEISLMKLAIFHFIISFGSFLAIALVPFGIHVQNLGGMLGAGFVVWCMALFTNYLEWRHAIHRE